MDYSQMIMAAIESTGGTTGCNKTAISNYIQANYPDNAAAHAALVSITLNKMKLAGQLVFAKNNYMKPDPNAPPKRGRGRPPKPKKSPPSGAADIVAPPSSPRPRGRPPKPRDPLAPAPAPPSGRPRGRPPKKGKAAAVDTPVVGGVKRGRGRPPKARPETSVADA